MKLKALSILALAVCMTACDEDFTNWADPQTSPEEGVAEGVTLNVTPAGAIDLSSVEGDSVTLFTPVVDAISGAASMYEIVLSNPDGSASTTLSADAEGRVAKAELQSLLEQYYGKRPVARDLASQVVAHVVLGGTSVKAVSESFTLAVTPEAPFIASAYYMVGDMFGWDADHMQQFVHSGKDVYEDPVFTITFTTSAANQYWKIIPQSNIDSGDFWHGGNDGVVGVESDGDASLEGKLVTTNPGAGKIEAAGKYQLTINMMDGTYAIKAVASYYFAVGNVNGWDGNNANAAFFPTSATVQSITTKFYNAWDLKIWNMNDYGNWDACLGSQVDGCADASGALIGSGAQAISSPETGWYTFTIDLSTNTYKWEKCSDQNPAEYAAIGIVGLNDDWDNDVNMTQITNNKGDKTHVWYAKDVTFDHCSWGCKFRVDHAWATSWGNSSEVPFGTASEGDNLTGVEPGTYDVYFNDITKQYLFIAK